MKFLINLSLVLLSLLLIGCFESVNAKENKKIWCVYQGGDLYRCENKEIICYQFRAYYKGGLSCHFKTSKK